MVVAASFEMVLRRSGCQRRGSRQMLEEDGQGGLDSGCLKAVRTLSNGQTRSKHQVLGARPLEYSLNQGQGTRLHVVLCVLSEKE